MIAPALRAALDLIQIMVQDREELEREIAHLKQELHETTQALQKAAAALEEVHDRLDAQEVPQAVPTPDAPLCLSRDPDHPSVFCELEEGHNGHCVGFDGDVDLSEMRWWTRPDTEPTLEDLDAIEAHPWEGDVPPEADDAPATPQPEGEPSKESDVDAVLSALGATGLADLHHHLNNPMYQPEGEPPPSEWPEPAPPEGPTTRTVSPRSAFRKLWWAFWKRYVAANSAEGYCPGDRERKKVLAAWYNGANTLSDPGNKPGKVTVHPFFFQDDDEGMGNHPDDVGTFAWLCNATDTDFATEVDSVLGVTRG